MLTGKEIAILVAVVLLIIVLASWYNTSGPAAAVAPAQVGASAPVGNSVPSLENPIMPPQAVSSPWCINGTYCNNKPVLQGDAYVGAPPVCGTDKVQYSCVMGANGQPAWNRMGTACTPSMLANC